MTRPLWGLADARHVIGPFPANTDRHRRSLSCGDCRRPIPAGTVRCRPCFAAAQRETAEIRRRRR